MVFAIVFIAHPSFPKNDHVLMQVAGGLNINLETFASAARVLLAISVDRLVCLTVGRRDDLEGVVFGGGFQGTMHRAASLST